MITEFQEEYRWLSNFWPARVWLDGEVYSTLEHAYQAGKTLFAAEREEIRLAPTPGKAKRLGKKITLRADWNDSKLELMEYLLRQKFAHHILFRKLMATGDQYIEESNRWHDNFWGNCVCTDCVNVYGQNHLGKLIMMIRSEMQAVQPLNGRE